MSLCLITNLVLCEEPFLNILALLVEFNRLVLATYLFLIYMRHVHVFCPSFFDGIYQAGINSQNFTGEHTPILCCICNMSSQGVGEWVLIFLKDTEIALGWSMGLETVALLDLLTIIIGILQQRLGRSRGPAQSTAASSVPRPPVSQQFARSIAFTVIRSAFVKSLVTPIIHVNIIVIFVERRVSSIAFRRNVQLTQFWSCLGRKVLERFSMASQLVRRTSR